MRDRKDRKPRTPFLQHEAGVVDQVTFLFIVVAAAAAGLTPLNLVVVAKASGLELGRRRHSVPQYDGLLKGYIELKSDFSVASTGNANLLQFILSHCFFVFFYSTQANPSL